MLDANVRTVVSLISRGEHIWMRDQLGDRYVDSPFHQNRFPIRDGAAPSRSTMRIILDTIDRSVESSRAVFVHCVGGRGRTGTVLGCWLARHGVATGVGALRALTGLRLEYGLVRPSPETDAQHKLVLSWQTDE